MANNRGVHRLVQQIDSDDIEHKSERMQRIQKYFELVLSRE